MKIICTKENIRRALNYSSKIINPTTTLPILNNILLKTSGGQLLVSSTNLEIAIKVWVGGKIEEQGEITVPGRTLTEYINSVPDDKIIIETNNNDLTLNTERTQSTLKGLPSDEYPIIPEVEADLKFNVPADVLIKSLSEVVFATSGSETQPELSGVLFFFENGKLRLVATDRYRLAEKIITLTNVKSGEKKVIIPNRAITELIRIASDVNGLVEIGFSENQALFKTENVELTTRLIEAQYPDYQQIIPTEFNTEVKIPSQELASSLKLTGLFAAESNNIEMQLSEAEGVVLNSVSQKSGSTTSRITTGKVKGEKVKILFNHRYLLDCLNHIKQESVFLKLINSAAPAMIVPEGEKDYLYLVMPIKT